MQRRLSSRTLLDGAIVLAAAAFVFLQLKPSLLLANTTPAGGDMGAHVWAPAYLRDHLLPHWRLSGWTPDWYDGFPALTFYFPLPSLLIVLLNGVLPYDVAFKLVTVAGVVTLPLAAYLFGRLSGVRFPGPALMSVATLPFLFDRFHTIYGGNIPATLAGEFSFSIALSFALVFLGVFARGMRTGRHRGLAAVLLACTALSHLLPTLFALGGALVLFLLHIGWRRLRYVLTALPVAGLLSAFWSFPFAMRLAYSNDMGWEKITAYLKNLFPFLSTVSTGNTAPNQFYWQQVWHLIPITALALAGGIACVVLRRRVGTALFILAVGSALVFWLAPPARLWNARALPFWFLSLYLLAAVALAEAVGGFAHLLDRLAVAPPLAVLADDDDIDSYDHDAPPLPTAPAAPVGSVASTPVDDGSDAPASPTDGAPAASPLVVNRGDWLRYLAPVLALIAAVVFVALPLDALPRLPFKTTDHSFIPDWVTWNYSGYERKAAYGEYKAVVATMAAIGKRDGCGRAMWEYESDLDRYGTPMALMLLPYWTHGCIGSMEGLYFESAASTAYHFLNQSELSKAPSRAQRDLPYANLDVARGIQHLQLMGVRYYMAKTPEAIAAAEADKDLTPIATSGPWRIYRVAHSAVVSPLRYEPAVVKGRIAGNGPWLDISVPWYNDPTRWDVPLAQSGPKDWPRVSVTRTPTADRTVGAGVSVSNPKRIPVPEAKVSRIRTTDDRISFDVDRPGSPVLVKASYFPNWQAAGAKGPWRVTPNLMVVVPTRTHVELHYGRTPVDWIGLALSFGGLLALVALWRLGPIEYPARRRPGAPRPGEANFDWLTTPGRPSAPAGDGDGDRKPVSTPLGSDTDS